jgi:hypothetical protein
LICGSFNDPVSNADYTPSNGWKVVNSEVERMSKAAPVVRLRYCTGVWLGKLRKIKRTSLKIIDVLSQIQIGHLMNTGQKFYSFRQLAW